MVGGGGGISGGGVGSAVGSGGFVVAGGGVSVVGVGVVTDFVASKCGGFTDVLFTIKIGGRYGGWACRVWWLCRMSIISFKGECVTGDSPGMSEMMVIGP